MLLLLLLGLAVGGFVPPFSRVLQKGSSGRDVVVLQNLLHVNASGTFDETTFAAVETFQKKVQLAVDGIAGQETLGKALTVLGPDNYRWDGTIPQDAKFFIHVPVFANRSVVDTAALYHPNGTKLFTFLTRACGQSWTGGLLNMFSPDGETPTGLMKADLNTKEPNPYLYGPYPIVRMVAGVEGNAAWLLPHLRNGILLHTGEWPLVNGWPPCSHGCVHTLMPMLKHIDELLMNDLGVVAHQNVGGEIPYPYPTQGYVAVDVQD